MKKIVCSLAGLLFLSFGLHAQGIERQTKTSANASQVYFEALGAGVIYSVNYDGRLSKMENGLGIRVGLGGYSADGEGYVGVPVQLNYLLGSQGQYLELGAGGTLVSGGDLFDNTASTYVLGSATIGFRKQPFGKKGLTWRFAFTPFFGAVGEGNSGFGLYPWIGASLGYRF